MTFAGYGVAPGLSADIKHHVLVREYNNPDWKSTGPLWGFLFLINIAIFPPQHKEGSTAGLEMVCVSLYRLWVKECNSYSSAPAGPEGYQVQPSVALKCSLCSLFTTALRLSGKTGGFILLFFRPIAALFLWFLRRLKEEVQHKSVGSLERSMVDQ